MNNEMIKKPRYGTDWEKELRDHEIMTREENGKTIKVVFLKGLQRCAQDAGLKTSDCRHSFISSSETGSVGILQCNYRVSFDDETTWVGTADCSSANTDKKYMAYPTAVAESRAEARALRKALNIQLLSSEEIGFNDSGVQQIEASTNKKIDSQVVKAIEKLCESRNIVPAELLENILEKSRASSIFELNELTVEEGQKAMSWLNDQKPSAPPKKTAKEEREARKQELLAKTADSEEEK